MGLHTMTYHDADDAAREQWAELDETHEAYEQDDEEEEYGDWLLNNDHLFRLWSNDMKDDAAISRAENACPREAPENWEP